MDAPPAATPSVPTTITNKEVTQVVSKKSPKASAHSQKGIFSPVVLAAKQILGEDELNQIRAKAIGLHSDVIARFVDTAETAAGNVILKALFQLADRDGSGTIDKEELKVALKTLRFQWLQDKQVDGIFQRADADGNGCIDMDEWIAEAPKTLRTNLIKLAKKNGGELGFLV
jgi:hypothetical protein